MKNHYSESGSWSCVCNYRYYPLKLKRRKKILDEGKTCAGYAHIVDKKYHEWHCQNQIISRGIYERTEEYSDLQYYILHHAHVFCDPRQK